MKQVDPQLEEWIRTNLTYDPTSGVVSGSASLRFKDGYVLVTVGEPGQKKEMTAHRVAWFLHCGTWPSAVDHKNMIRDDNRIENLREASHSQNASNTVRRHQGARVKSKYKGVYHDRGRWQAKIKHNGKDMYLGVFATEEEAHAAYAAAAVRLHGEFARI